MDPYKSKHRNITIITDMLTLTQLCLLYISRNNILKKISADVKTLTMINDSFAFKFEELENAHNKPRPNIITCLTNMKFKGIEISFSDRFHLHIIFSKPLSKGKKESITLNMVIGYKPNYYIIYKKDDYRWYSEVTKNELKMLFGFVGRSKIIEYLLTFTETKMSKLTNVIKLSSKLIKFNLKSKMHLMINIDSHKYKLAYFS